MSYFEVRRGNTSIPLFEGLTQDLAIGFAQGWFKRTGEVCEIDEIQHEPKKFQSTVEP